MATEADFRLPRTVVPSHYGIRLVPDLAAATFTGTVAIDVDVAEATSSVVMNALDLTITSASVVADAVSLDADWSLDEERDRLTLELDGVLPAGPAVVHVAFEGVLNDLLRGFYRSTYTDDDGTEHVIATTQFEATDARRAFPCWDEPDLKATFTVALVVDEHLQAFSNGAEVERVPLGDGTDEVRFAETMKMSTYLVAFIVGSFEVTDAVDVDGVPLRIATPPGKLHLTDFALDAGAHALRFFADYYDVPYPGGKLDMVAIPDFAWGAMENLGCVTYRETALLVDTNTATRREMMRVAAVIAHEIAHMWFGDLVTMKWWNGIWLNEAFASFAELKATDAYRPDWKMWLDFAAERARSQETDALHTTRPIEIPVASPSEADAMFDVLTYEKGSSVLRMLEQFLGEDTFRAGVSHYLKTHAFGNTDNEDLWRSLETVSDVPVGEIMDTWIFQGGFPVVEAHRSGADVTLSQRQFNYLDAGSTEWKVPVLYRSTDGDGKVLLETDPIAVAMGDDVVVNSGGEGFFRVEYDDELMASVVDRIEDLDPIERFGIINDTFANVLAGHKTSADFLPLVHNLRGEREGDVWTAALAGLGELDRVVSSDDRSELQGFTRDLVGPEVEELGWTVGADDDEQTRALRGQLLKAMGVLGNDRDTIANAREVHLTADESLDAEIADAALTITAANGDMGDFQRFLDLSDSAPTPQLTVKYLRAAVSVPDPAVPARVVDMVADREIRNQDSFWVLAVLLGARDTGPIAWNAVKARWDDLLAVLPPSNAYRMLDLLYLRSEPEVAADIASFLEANPIPGAEMKIAQRLEQLRVRVGLREREGTAIGEALRSA